jgi:hypothetical protein
MSKTKGAAMAIGLSICAISSAFGCEEPRVPLGSRLPTHEEVQFFNQWLHQLSSGEVECSAVNCLPLMATELIESVVQSGDEKSNHRYKVVLKPSVCFVPDFHVLLPSTWKVAASSDGSIMDQDLGVLVLHSVYENDELNARAVFSQPAAAESPCIRKVLLLVGKPRNP